MKSTIKFFGAVASMAALLVSCVKEEIKNTTPDTVHIDIIAGTDESTKTVLGENGQVNWCLSGEKLAVWQNSTYVKSEVGVSTDGGATMKFGATFPSGTAPYSYYAVYPNMAAYKPGETSGSSASAAKIDLRQAQYPTATSFGPSSDILVAKPVTGLSEQPAELSLQFARMVAVGKMQIKNLNSTENVTRVTFKADGKKIAGRNAMDLTKDITVAEVSGEINPAQDNIALAYNGESIAANGMTAYFTCWPFAMTAGETFTVEVYTPSKYFTKTVTLPRALEFKQGRASSFTVDFSGIEGVERQHFNYAKLEYSDFQTAGGTSDYSLTTVKPDGLGGPIWDCLAFNSAGIQLRNLDDVNDSYIKLPTFKDDIREVRVYATAASYNGRNICLESSAAGTTKANSKTLISGQSEPYVFDLAGKGMKTAYLRGFGGAIKISKVEVFAGEDTRTQLAAPSNIKAALVDGTPNSIKVTWDAVENAGSYVVTATSTNGDAVSETVTEPSHTFTNLAYETEYTISVVAKPADAAAYKDSEAGVCADKVKTSANTSTSRTVTYTVTSTTAVTTSGEAPAGSSVTFKNTYSTKDQMTGGNSQTYTLKGYSGCTIKGVVLNMKSNSGKGAGTFSITAGTTKLAEIASATDFNQWYDNTSFGTAYRDVNVSLLSDSYMIQDGEDVVIKIAATVNSLYCSSISIEYDTTPDTREPLATPVVTARLDETNADVTNSIIVNWNAIEGAGTYEVTAVPANGNPVSETVTGITHTFTGLAYNTEYTISVVAKPTDTASYKDSEAGVAAAVTTGTNPNAGGDVKTYTLTIDQNTFDKISSTSGYAAYNGTHTLSATSSDGSSIDVEYVTNQIMVNSSKIQGQKNTGYIYNKTDLGSIVSITYTSGSNYSHIIGSTENPSTSSSDGGYFKISAGTSTALATSIVITFTK